MLSRFCDRRCYHCRAFVGEARFGHCRLNPPQVSPMLVEKPSGKIADAYVARNDAGDIDCNYPPVNPVDSWCLSYRRHWRRWWGFVERA